MDIELMKQAINNCFMTKKYGHPGLEAGMCAGSRTDSKKPCKTCKECKLLYLNKDAHS